MSRERSRLNKNTKKSGNDENWTNYKHNKIFITEFDKQSKSKEGKYIQDLEPENKDKGGKCQL